MAGVAPAVKIICDGLKDTDLSMTWDMNPATAFVIRKISVKGRKTKNNKNRKTNHVHIHGDNIHCAQN